MTPSIIIVIILTLVVIGVLTYMSLRTETGYFSVVPISKPKSPKDQLVDYFAMNWSRIATVLVRKNCEDDNIPQEFIDEFKDQFGHLFMNQEVQDPMLKHYTNGTYERNFKMEINEMCKTLNSLGDFINKYPTPLKQVDLKTLGKEIERLHTEHFPQAVFISVILDRMLEICKKYPEYNINQIANTQDLLTMSVIFYLYMPTKYW
jgi:hypothetical protein